MASAKKKGARRGRRRKKVSSDSGLSVSETGSGSKSPQEDQEEAAGPVLVCSICRGVFSPVMDATEEGGWKGKVFMTLCLHMGLRDYLNEILAGAPNVGESLSQFSLCQDCKWYGARLVHLDETMGAMMVEIKELACSFRDVIHNAGPLGEEEQGKESEWVWNFRRRVLAQTDEDYDHDADNSDDGAGNESYLQPMIVLDHSQMDGDHLNVNNLEEEEEVGSFEANQNFSVEANDSGALDANHLEDEEVRAFEANQNVSVEASDCDLLCRETMGTSTLNHGDEEVGVTGLGLDIGLPTSFSSSESSEKLDAMWSASSDAHHSEGWNEEIAFNVGETVPLDSAGSLTRLDGLAADVIFPDVSLAEIERCQVLMGENQEQVVESLPTETGSTNNEHDDEHDTQRDVWKDLCDRIDRESPLPPPFSPLTPPRQDQSESEESDLELNSDLEGDLFTRVEIPAQSAPISSGRPEAIITPQQNAESFSEYSSDSDLDDDDLFVKVPKTESNKKIVNTDPVSNKEKDARRKALISKAMSLVSAPSAKKTTRKSKPIQAKTEKRNNEKQIKKPSLSLAPLRTPRNQKPAGRRETRIPLPLYVLERDEEGYFAMNKLGIEFRSPVVRVERVEPSKYIFTSLSISGARMLLPRPSSSSTDLTLPPPVTSVLSDSSESTETRLSFNPIKKRKLSATDLKPAKKRQKNNLTHDKDTDVEEFENRKIPQLHCYAGVNILNPDSSDSALPTQDIENRGPPVLVPQLLLTKTN